jgi:hypothetical protein
VVKRAHVVPRCYLQQFAEHGNIAARVDGSALSKIIRLDDAAVRRYFYRRTRADGTPIDDVEWSLSKIEGVVAPLLKTLRDRWPLDLLTEKAVLAEFFAIQLVRGPRWKDWHKDFTKGFVDEKRVDQRSDSDEGSVRVQSVLDQDESDVLERYLLDDTQRLVQMIGLGWKIAGLLGSMHWALIEFGAPVVATSDHPVVLWPRDVRARQAEPTPMNLGLFETLEVRIPVAPTLAILMTWADRPDREHDRLRGTRRHAASLNAFTVAEAERQWFHLPRRVPPIGSGSFLPLSPELMPGYTPTAAASSRRRAQTSAHIQPKLGREVDEPTFDLVTLTA